VFEFFTPGIAQVLKLAGCEFVIYDMEHAGFSIEQLKEQCAYCRGTGIAPMVRVPRGEYHFLGASPVCARDGCLGKPNCGEQR
jgi:2-keto-3-deoxy-L-rhamnonate aldolase RhmA